MVLSGRVGDMFMLYSVSVTIGYDTTKIGYDILRWCTMLIDDIYC